MTGTATQTARSNRVALRGSHISDHDYGYTRAAEMLEECRLFGRDADAANWRQRLDAIVAAGAY